MTSNTLELVVGTTLLAISVGFMGGAWFLTWLFERINGDAEVET